MRESTAKQIAIESIDFNLNKQAYIFLDSLRDLGLDEAVISELEPDYGLLNEEAKNIIHDRGLKKLTAEQQEFELAKVASMAAYVFRNQAQVTHEGIRAAPREKLEVWIEQYDERLLEAHTAANRRIEAVAGSSGLDKYVQDDQYCFYSTRFDHLAGLYWQCGSCLGWF